MRMEEKKRRYETHLHTKEVSACASLSGTEQVRLYKEMGYDGIIVTDHFFGGNTLISSHLPWEEKIDLFYLGYEAAKKEGDKIGLEVMFGLESNFHGTEFLVYGIDKEFLKAHPQMNSYSIEEQYQIISKINGLIVHAHPFRGVKDTKSAKIYPEFIHAVEVYNLGNKSPIYNERAAAYAQEYHKSITGGGDAHNLDSFHGGIITKKPLKDIYDYIALIKSGTGYEIIK